jgi:hypothetical protein
LDDGYASLEDARGATVIELIFITQQDERLGAPRQSPSFGLVEGKLSSEEIFQVWGLPVRIWCDPILFPSTGKASSSMAEGTSGWAEAFSGSGVSSI